MITGAMFFIVSLVLATCDAKKYSVVRLRQMHLIADLFEMNYTSRSQANPWYGEIHSISHLQSEGDIANAELYERQLRESSRFSFSMPMGGYKKGPTTPTASGPAPTIKGVPTPQPPLHTPVPPPTQASVSPPGPSLLTATVEAPMTKAPTPAMEAPTSTGPREPISQSRPPGPLLTSQPLPPIFSPTAPPLKSITNPPTPAFDNTTTSPAQTPSTSKTSPTGGIPSINIPPSPVQTPSTSQPTGRNAQPTPVTQPPFAVPPISPPVVTPTMLPPPSVVPPNSAPQSNPVQSPVPPPTDKKGMAPTAPPRTNQSAATPTAPFGGNPNQPPVQAPVAAPKSIKGGNKTVPSQVPTIMIGAPTASNVNSFPTRKSDVHEQATPSTPVSLPSSLTDRAQSIASKCLANETKRSADLLNQVSGVSTYNDLADSSTVQYRALDWLDKLDGMIICADKFEDVAQRYIMALIYFSMNGPQWNECRSVLSVLPGNCTQGSTRWLDVSHECDWFGLSCGGDTQRDISKAVTTISLKHNNLTGTLPFELFFLVDLIGLSLDHNKLITGTIPEAIATLQKLTYLELDDNAMTGTIPNSIYTMKSLQAIDLNTNQLSGAISEDIAYLSQLEVLQVENNHFNGPIPWSGLSKLTDLRK